MRTQEVPFIASTEVFVDHIEDTLHERLGDFAASIPRSDRTHLHNLPHLRNKLDFVGHIAALDPSKQEAFAELRGLGLLHYLGKVVTTQIEQAGTPSVILPALSGEPFWATVDQSVYMHVGDLAFRESGIVLAPFETLNNDGVHEIGYLDTHALSRSASSVTGMVEYSATTL